MKRIIALSLMTSALIFATTGCGKKSEKTDEKTIVSNQPKFTSEEGNFKIAFPGEPTISFDTVSTEIGDVQMKMYMYEKSSEEAYMVAYTDYPQEEVDAKDIKEILQGSKEGAVKSLNASIEEEKEIMINNYPGIYFKAKGSDYAIAYKIFLVKNRLFQIGIIKSSSYPTDDDIKGFLDSFELISK